MKRPINTFAYMNWLRILALSPFSFIYYCVNLVRNMGFRLKWLKSVSFEVPVICVGNLNTGGTGKTPLTAYLITKLISENPAVLSRGYGRKTKNFILVTPQSTAKEVGDECVMLKRKFQGLPIAVCEDRVIGMTELLHHYPNSQLVIMDDGFQHQYIKPSLSILLTRFNNPFFNDYILPSGNLREPRNGADRAQILVVTKTPPNIEKKMLENYRNEIKKYTNATVFFSGVKYSLPIPVNLNSSSLLQGSKVIVFSGIADDSSLIQHVSEHYKIIKIYSFRDHQNLSFNKIKEIFNQADNSVSFITTPKDLARISGDNEISQYLQNYPLYTIDYDLFFLNQDEEKFLFEIQKHGWIRI